MNFAWTLMLLAGNLAAADFPRAFTHSNEHSAARLENGVYQLDLVIQEARLHPEADDGYSVVLPLFGVSDTAPSAPGPLIRVPEGSRIHIRVMNLLPVPASVYGLHTRPGDPREHFDVPPGETREREFVASGPGSFFYWGAVEEKGRALGDPERRDGALGGVLQVDPKGRPVEKNESIFLIQHFAGEGPPSVAPPQSAAELWLVNGRMWPFTPRQTVRFGESFLWRWINASVHLHPMHLHGNYFQVVATGDSERETLLPKDKVLSVVTEGVEAGHSFVMRWKPLRPGNWFMHCHVLVHTSPLLGAWNKETVMSVGHSEMGMSGLVVGVKVLPTAAYRPEAVAEHPRKIVMLLRETGQKYPPDPDMGSLPRLAVTFMDAASQEPASPVNPGPTLVLERGQPVAIEVRNQMNSPATIHWHGIELESYFDGVHDFGGDEQRKAPMIMPGETFTVRFTPPRAGTFIYHAHTRDYQEISAGLYGALLVVPPGGRLDPDSDRVFLFSRDGPDDSKAPFLLNGANPPRELHVRAGKKYRLRFIDISPNHGRQVTISRNGDPVAWRPLAKDGADLPSDFPLKPATFFLNVGETYDFEWTPESGPDYSLYVGHSSKKNHPLNLMTRIIVDND